MDLLIASHAVSQGMTLVTNNIRHFSSVPGLKVLFTTGYTRNAIVHNGMLDPDVSLLTKPFTLEQLARKIAEILKR